MLGLFRRLFGRERSTLPPFDFARNRFHVRKKWPPNLRQLTEHQQFRFERKFKRRIRLKAIRPQWNKWVKITQWSLISFVIVYGVLFHDFAKDPMNPRPGEQVFKGIRDRMWGVLGKFYTHTEGALNETREGRHRLAPIAPGQPAAGAEVDSRSGEGTPAQEEVARDGSRSRLHR